MHACMSGSGRGVSTGATDSTGEKAGGRVSTAASTGEKAGGRCVSKGAAASTRHYLSAAMASASGGVDPTQEAARVAIAVDAE